MPKVTVAIEHRLGEPEARRRIGTLLHKVRALIRDMGGTWSEPRLNLTFSHGPGPLALHVPFPCSAALVAILFGSTNCAQCMECFGDETKKISGREKIRLKEPDCPS